MIPLPRRPIYRKRMAVFSLGQGKAQTFFRSDWSSRIERGLRVNPFIKHPISIFQYDDPERFTKFRCTLGRRTGVM